MEHRHIVISGTLSCGLLGSQGWSFSLPPLGSIVAVPGATSSKFNFIASTPGTYDISIKVTDSLGNSVYNVFNPGGIWVFVQASPAPTSPPSTIDITPLNITSLSPENKTYTANDIPLSFSLSKPANRIGYSMDGQANITIDGNSTLTGLSNGSHTLTIYANDTYGNTAAPQTITFTINQPASFPTTEAAATTTAIVIVAGGLIYFMKRKHSLA